MLFIGTSRTKLRNLKPLWVLTTGLLLGLGESAQSIPPTLILDSSVGKAPFQVLANAAGAVDTAQAWDSLSRSFRGKAPTMIISDGPPPRRQAAPIMGSAATRFFYVYADLRSQGNAF